MKEDTLSFSCSCDTQLDLFSYVSLVAGMLSTVCLVPDDLEILIFPHKFKIWVKWWANGPFQDLLKMKHWVILHSPFAILQYHCQEKDVWKQRGPGHVAAFTGCGLCSEPAVKSAAGDWKLLCGRIYKPDYLFKC